MKSEAGPGEANGAEANADRGERRSAGDLDSAAKPMPRVDFRAEEEAFSRRVATSIGDAIIQVNTSQLLVTGWHIRIQGRTRGYSLAPPNEARPFSESPQGCHLPAGLPPFAKGLNRTQPTERPCDNCLDAPRRPGRKHSAVRHDAKSLRPL